MGLLHTDPRSVCPLSSAEFLEPPPPKKNPGYATVQVYGLSVGMVLIHSPMLAVLLKAGNI
jgi:hypothetical protein